MIDYGYEMYDDVKSGRTTRELETKYNCSILSIATFVKNIDQNMWCDPSSPVYEIKDKIKKRIDSTVIINGGKSGN